MGVERRDGGLDAVAFRLPFADRDFDEGGLGGEVDVGAAGIDEGPGVDEVGAVDVVVALAC